MKIISTLIVDFDDDGKATVVEVREEAGLFMVAMVIYMNGEESSSIIFDNEMTLEEAEKVSIHLQKELEKAAYGDLQIFQKAA